MAKTYANIRASEHRVTCYIMGDDNDFDVSQDYYAILGVTKDSTTEEIKTAHVKLALESHPDSLKPSDRGNKLVDDGGARFRRVSEAWSVLSRPDLKKAYDSARLANSASALRGVAAAAAPTEIVEESFATQRAHYNTAVKAAAMSNWREAQDKYKTQKWQAMTLDQKKVSRRQTVTKAGGGLAGIVGAGLLFFGTAGMIYNSMMSPGRRR